MDELDAAEGTVHWGYLDRDLAPVLGVGDGATVRVRTVTHRAGDAPDLLMDESIERLYAEVRDRGPGPHVLCGPVAVGGARPGDVLEVGILSLEPRLGHGSNLASRLGHLHGDFGKERVTIWSTDVAAGTARALFAYDCPPGPRSSAPGTVVDPRTTAREPVDPRLVVPLRPHLGVVGVAPAEPGRHSSVPPGDFGGNVDNRRAGAGSRLYLPVQVPDALVSFGDPHMAQGDGELSGTALEASIDATLRLRLRRDIDIEGPVLETATDWHVHGFGDTLDGAMTSAARRVVAFLGRNFGIAADEAYSLASVAVDFCVTQVVDLRVGVHGSIPKSVVGGLDPA